MLLLLPGFFVGWNSQNFEFYTSVWFKVEFFLLVTKIQTFMWIGYQRYYTRKTNPKKKHCHSMKEKPMARVNFVIRTGYVQLNALHSHLLCLWFVKTWLSFECKLNHLGVRFFLFSIHLFLSLWLATTKHVTEFFGLDSCMRRVYLFDWMLRRNRQIQSRSNSLINKYCSNGYRAIWWQVIPNCKRIKYYVYLFLWFGLFSPIFLNRFDQGRLVIANFQSFTADYHFKIWLEILHSKLNGSAHFVCISWIWDIFNF